MSRGCNIMGAEPQEQHKVESIVRKVRRGLTKE